MGGDERFEGMNLRISPDQGSTGVKSYSNDKKKKKKHSRRRHREAGRGYARTTTDTSMWGRS